MSWKDLPKDKWRPCTICGHMIKKQYMPSSMAGGIYAAGQNVGCENAKTDWHVSLVNKKYLLMEMKDKQYPLSVIDELEKEILELESKIPKPLP